MQKTFSFAVRDTLINVGPWKYFSYGLRINADLNAGIAKQSNYELVSIHFFKLSVSKIVKYWGFISIMLQLAGYVLLSAVVVSY